MCYTLSPAEIRERRPLPGSFLTQREISTAQQTPGVQAESDPGVQAESDPGGSGGRVESEESAPEVQVESGFPKLILRKLLHSHNDPAARSLATGPSINEVVDLLPSTEIEIPNAKIRPLRNLEGVRQGWEQGESYVVEDSWHLLMYEYYSQLSAFSRAKCRNVKPYIATNETRTAPHARAYRRGHARLF